jgi:hypothetical protein
MKILKHDFFRDGGTMWISTDKGEIFIDGRCDTGLKTVGMLFLTHPSESEPISTIDAKRWKSQLKSAVKSYAAMPEYGINKIKAIKIN